MRLDPDVAALLRRSEARNPIPMQDLPIAEARQEFERISVLLSGEGAVVADVTDATAATSAGDLAVRIYRPEVSTDPPAAVLYLHGGGFVVGSIESHDPICRDLAAGSGVVVCSLEYRLAPEFPFPSGLEDCLAAFQWLHSNADELGVDGRRLAIAGDSAGGNLAIATSLLARDRGWHSPDFQLLIYPCVDLTMSSDTWHTFESGYWLEASSMRWMIDSYLSGGQPATDALASPLFADLSLLPPSHVITAEFDPLRDEGEELSNRLGVGSTCRRFDGMVHGALGLTAVVPRATEMIAEAATALRDHLG
jgi:acetyl esterase